MSMFDDFFQRAMGGERAAVPYPYQTRFATQATLPHLLRVPTSAGKTATAILGWLYRWQTQPAVTPRQLVYCLPMRVLVEQSEREARRWIKNLGLDISVHVLTFVGRFEDEIQLHVGRLRAPHNFSFNGAATVRSRNACAARNCRTAEASFNGAALLTGIVHKTESKSRSVSCNEEIEKTPVDLRVTIRKIPSYQKESRALRAGTHGGHGLRSGAQP